jgi:hypothetical protein
MRPPTPPPPPAPPVSACQAHRLKNDATQTNRTLDGLACKRRVLLSGTPMQNHLDEVRHLAGRELLAVTGLNSLAFATVAGSCLCRSTPHPALGCGAARGRSHPKPPTPPPPPPTAPRLLSDRNHYAALPPIQ